LINYLSGAREKLFYFLVEFFENTSSHAKEPDQHFFGEQKHMLNLVNGGLEAL